MELDEQQREAWARDGFLVLRRALDERRVAEMAFGERGVEHDDAPFAEGASVTTDPGE